MDVFDAATRSRIMSGVRTRDTDIERLVRSYLHRHGLRFRLQGNHLPGKPDIVLTSRRAVVFVHGCFWHGHTCKRGSLPKTRTAFWRKKIGANRARDAAAVAELKALGWTSETVWACDLNEKTLGALARRLLRRRTGAPKR